MASVSIVSTWVFALLPANLVPLLVGELVDRFGVRLGLAGLVATVMTLANAAASLTVRSVVATGRRGLVSGVGVGVTVGAYLVAALFAQTPIVLGALVVGGAGAGR